MAAMAHTSEIVLPSFNKPKAIQQPFKKIRVVGKKATFLTKRDGQRVAIKKTVNGSVKYTYAYILIVNKYLDKKLNNTDDAISLSDAVNYLKEINILEGNVKSINTLDGTTIGDVIRKKVINHIKWVKNKRLH